MKECPDCKQPMQAQTRSHRYDEVGFPGVILENVKVYTCSPCGRHVPAIASVATLHAKIALCLVCDYRRVTPAEFRFLRTVLGLDIAGLARLMGLKARTVERWESGIDPIGNLGERLLRTLVFCEKYEHTHLLFSPRPIEGKDLHAVLSVLRPVDTPRTLRLQGREVVSQPWGLVSRQLEKAATPKAPPPVRLVATSKTAGSGMSPTPRVDDEVEDLLKDL